MSHLLYSRVVGGVRGSAVQPLLSEVSMAEPEPPTATGTALTALSSHARSYSWQHCKEKSVLPLEQQEMGQLRGARAVRDPHTCTTQ